MCCVDTATATSVARTIWGHRTGFEDARSRSGVFAEALVGEDTVLSSDAAVGLSAGEVLAAEASALTTLQVAAHAAVDGQEAGDAIDAHLCGGKEYGW